MKRVKLIIVFVVLILSTACAGGVSSPGASGSSSGAAVSEADISSTSQPESSLQQEPEPPVVLPNGRLPGLKWGFASIEIPGAVRVPTEGYIKRYSCGNFLDEDTLIFATHHTSKRDADQTPLETRFAIYEYKISEQTMRQVYENTERILGDPLFPFVARLEETSLIVSNRDASIRFSLPDYQLISGVESPVARGDLFHSKTKMFDPLAIQEEKIKTPEWGYGYYYDKGKAFIRFGHALEGGNSVKLEFAFGEEGKLPVVLEIPMEHFPKLPPPRADWVHGFDLRDAQYAPDTPYFVARVKFEGAFIGCESATALLVCNYETGRYYLTEFVHGNSSFNLPVFNEDQSKVLFMTQDFEEITTKEEGVYDRKAYMTTFIIDIEELLKHGRGGKTT